MTGPDDELAAAVDDVYETGPRLSPALRRFAAGEMGDDEALRRGYLPCRPDGPPPDDLA